MRKYYKIIFSIFAFTFICCNLIAQDKRDYLTPQGKSLFYKQINDANGLTISMDQLSEVSAQKNGLSITFFLKADLSSIVSPLKLLSFFYDTETSTFLEVFYHNGTIMVRRRVNLLEPKLTYDYELFDPLFDIEAGQTDTRIVSIFFTRDFFWIETGNSAITVPDRRHSAIFFAIDIPTYTFMAKYLQRDSKAKIKLGDSSFTGQFSMPGEVNIYEFNQDDLVNELQKNFCDNN